MMKYALGNIRPMLELQPDRNANTLVGVGQWGKRLVVGTDTGSQRLLNIYQHRQGNHEFVNDISLTTQLDGEFNSLAMSHDGLKIACGDCYNALPSGAVFVFNLVDGDLQYGLPVNFTLPQVAALTLSPPVADAYFGASCCFYNATGGVFVGATGISNDRGSVFLFEPVAGVWTQKQEIPGPVGAKGFGSAVSVTNDGSLLAIGAPWSDYYQGRVYIYARDANGIYQLRDTLIPGDVGGQFGAGVAISPDGQWLYVGAPAYSNVQSRQGTVVVYRYLNNAWVKTANWYRIGAWSWENLGLNLAISQDGQQVMAGMACSALLFDAYRYLISGQVKDENGNPASMEVRAHLGYYGDLINTTWSDEETGNFELATSDNSPHMVACVDSDEAGIYFNAQVFDGVVPL